MAYGNTVWGLARCAISTPETVTILKVDPGGCRPSRPIPATARICPEGRIRTTPPYWDPSAATVSCCSAGEMLVCTGAAACGSTEASTRLPASS